MESNSIPQSNKASINLDLSVYPLIAIEKAAYAFSDKGCCIVRGVAEGSVTIEIDCSASKVDPAQLMRDFVTKVGGFSLQAKIDSQTRIIRDALISAALSEALPK